MSDLFHERVPLDYAALVARVMRDADWHTFQLLTKRAPRLEAASQLLDLDAPNVIVGASVEDRKHGVPRIDSLRRARVGARFLSIEPLLEDLGELDLSGIDWVIVGGESGPGARPIEATWVHGIRRQCEAQGVHFFFKQWGGVDKKKAGRLLDGRTYDGAPTLVSAPVPPDRERRRRRLELEGLLGELRPRLMPTLVPIRAQR